jgi:hypothetical protein
VKAIAALRGTTIEPAHVGPALVALESHLTDPATSTPDLALIVEAMSAIGGGAERPVLSSHLLLYHADDDVGADAGWTRSIVAALTHKPGPLERELLRQVASDPRTKQGLGQAIQEALGKQ